MAQGYGYGNARLRAMYSRLLTESDLGDLLSETSIEAVITRLTETPYRDDVETALVRFGGVRCVFEALRTNLVRTLRKVQEFYEGRPRDLVFILLRYWDRHNLLTILRGQSQQLSPEVILSAIVPVGLLDIVALREMARQPGLRAAIDLMTTWGLPCAGELRSVRARTGTVPDVDQLELALNCCHYTSLRRALHPDGRNRAMVGEHIQTEIDLVNISTALRLVRSPELLPVLSRRYQDNGIQSLLVEPGGHLPVTWLARTIAESSELEGFVRALGATRYGPALESGWQRYRRGDGGIAVIERELERWQAARAAAMFRSSPLSIAIPIGYLSRKKAEIGNLRLIAQAVALDMNREQVRRDLITV